MNSPDKQFEQRARQLWREAARQVDPVTAGRLRAARRRALESAQASSRPLVRWLIPTGALAAIALATMMVWQPLPNHQSPTAMSSLSSDDLDNELPPDADQTDPNLYQNLDFYDWLASTSSQTAQR